MAARRKDMGSLYAKHMEHFGCGVAMYHPVSAVDMRPPCVGYLDINRRWNHITNIEWEGDDKPDAGVYEPLEKVPQKLADVRIEWRPRTSLGVREYLVDAKGQTPYGLFKRFLQLVHLAHHRVHHSDVGLPAGADATVRYASKTSFGAILIAQKPVSLTSYNDETLFRHWINKNRATLARLHGVELSRYGLWLVTRTYTAPKVSINAWESKDKDASLSVKVKANMMGDLGTDVDWSEKGADKDWTHYSGDQGVVAFFDGIEVPAWQWWLDGIKARVGKDVGLAKQQMMPNRAGLLPHGSWKPTKGIDPRRQSAPGADDIYIKQSPIDQEKSALDAADAAQRQLANERLPMRQPRTFLAVPSSPVDDSAEGQEPEPEPEPEPAAADLWGSSSPLRNMSPISSARSLSRGRPGSVSLRAPSRSSRHVSTPTRLSKYMDDDRYPQRDRKDPTLRLSTATTAAGNGGSSTKDHAYDEAVNQSTDRAQRHGLRRKTSSPSLRHSSPRELFAYDAAR